MLAGQPVVSHTIAAFLNAGVSRILLVIHPDDRARAEALAGVTLVHGGSTRDASVRNALEALAADSTGGPAPDTVLIHDGARPLVSVDVIARVLGALDSQPGAAPALQVTDALWRGEAGLVTGTQDRTALWRAQTPQGFRFTDILDAHRAHRAPAADDVAVARAAGLSVAIVEGCDDNIKLTFPADFARAETILKDRA